MGSAFGGGRRTVLAVLIGLACVAATMTLVVAHVTPHGTTDLDEVAYESQANAIAHHDLTLPAAPFDPFFRPFLSGVRGDRVVFKYQPEWPALIAASNGLFGSTLPLRVLLAILGLLTTAWFGWELTRDARIALLAAALVVASPLAWVQSASLLSYQWSFVLGTAVAAALLRSGRSRAVGPGLLAGALIGLAVFHRPFDAVLAIAPVLVYWCWSAARAHDLRRRLVPVGLSGLPFAAAFLAYNRSVMGSLTHLAYNVTGPADTFGFGQRASFSGPAGGYDIRLDYTVGRAVSSLGHLLVVLPRFVGFAPVVVALAAFCGWVQRRDARVWLLVAMVVVVVIGYFFWWGVANAYHFHLDRSLGPFYYYPLLAPLCVLAAWGVTLVRRSIALVTVGIVVAVAWGGVASAIVMRDARDAGRSRTAEIKLLQAPAPALVLESPQFPGDPYLRVATDATLRSGRIVAVDVPDRRFDLLDRFPGRTAYLVRAYQHFGDLFGPQQHDRVELHVVRAPAVIVRATVHLDPGRAGTLYLQIGNGPPQMATAGAGTFAASFVVSAAMLTSGTRQTTIAVGVALAPAGAVAPRAVTGEWAACALPARRAASDVEVMEPCDGMHHYVFPGGVSATTSEDVSTHLQLQVDAR